MKPCIFYLVRHGQSTANLHNVVGGHGDEALTDLGLQQADEARKIFAGTSFDAVYSSDLQRAYKTAEIIAGQPVPVDHQLTALRERNFCQLEGRPIDEWFVINDTFYKNYGSLPLTERWQHSYSKTVETNAQLVDRFLGALAGIAKDHAGQKILIGTHAGPVRMTLAMLGYADEIALGPGSFQNTAYVVLEYDGVRFKVQKVHGVTLGKASAE